MFGAILGDIIGSPYEFDRNNHKSTDFPLFSDKSRFTDDTVMTCAVAQALMETAGQRDEQIQQRLTACMQTLGRAYPYAGYGGRFARWLTEESPRPYNSWGNGSAMRVSAVGLLYGTMAETLHMAELTAAVTHNHPDGIKGAQAIAAAMYLIRAGAPKQRMAAYITGHFGYDLQRPLDVLRAECVMDVSCRGTVPIALRAFLEGNDFEQVVRMAVSVGGDSDTIACMAGAVASCRYDIPENILEEGRKRLTEPLEDICERFLKYLKENARLPRESWQSLTEDAASGTGEDARI